MDDTWHFAGPAGRPFSVTQQAGNEGGQEPRTGTGRHRTDDGHSFIRDRDRVRALFLLLGGDVTVSGEVDSLLASNHHQVGLDTPGITRKVEAQPPAAGLSRRALDSGAQVRRRGSREMVPLLRQHSPHLRPPPLFHIDEMHGLWDFQVTATPHTQP